MEKVLEGTEKWIQHLQGTLLRQEGRPRQNKGGGGGGGGVNAAQVPWKNKESW